MTSQFMNPVGSPASKNYKRGRPHETAYEHAQALVPDPTTENCNTFDWLIVRGRRALVTK
jgi:hypothetical protein